MTIGFIPNNTSSFGESAPFSVRMNETDAETTGFDMTTAPPTDTTPTLEPTVPYCTVHVAGSPARYNVIANSSLVQFTIQARQELDIDNDIIHGAPGSFIYINLKANQSGFIIRVPGRPDRTLPPNSWETFNTHILEVDASNLIDNSGSMLEINVEYISPTSDPGTPSPDTPFPDTPSPETPSPENPSPEWTTEAGVAFSMRNFRLLKEDD